MEIILVTCEADLPDEPHHKQPHTQDNDCINPVEEAVSAVEAPVVEPEKATPKKKAVRKRKKATPRSKRPKQAAKPVAEPVLSIDEGKVILGRAKDEFVVAVAEPAMKALGRWSEMARDTLAGAVGGFLGNKRRKD